MAFYSYLCVCGSIECSNKLVVMCYTYIKPVDSFQTNLQYKIGNLVDILPEICTSATSAGAPEYQSVNKLAVICPNST